MKKLLFSLFLLALLAHETKANPGDTTWVTICNTTSVTAWGDVNFNNIMLPTGKTFRKINLHYVLGATSTNSSALYDYLTRVWVKPAGNDTMEIARVITPFAGGWKAAGRTNDYVIDVTEYASVLQGNTSFRYYYDGYQYVYSYALKLEMIEGTPPMTVNTIENIYTEPYGGGRRYYYGTATSIETKLTTQQLQITSPSTKAYVKTFISGHASDNGNQCAEFCEKYYELILNGTSMATQTIWRNDCGLNEIYPQTGTWIYNRGNWCPGNTVKPLVHAIPGSIAPNTTFTLNMDMEPYTSPGSPAGQDPPFYYIGSQLVSYSTPNFSTDVSIEDIISPSNNPNYARSNSTCSNPIIKLKNTGSSNVTSVVFNYNLKGGATYTYTWTGNLAFLEETIVDLGSSQAMFNGNESNEFEVSINSVNGTSGDQNTFNNTYRSTFVDVKSYPGKFVVYFKTNSATSPINGSFNEANWKIVDQAGTIVKSRISNANNTVYNDTVNLANGCYTFIADDDDCDGIAWWANSDGTGVMKFNSSTSAITLKSFNGDFGCRLTERFTVGYYLNVKETSDLNNNFQLFPNPASSDINLLFDVKEYQDVNYSILDVTGKEVIKGDFSNISSVNYSINTDNLSNGIYFINCKFSKGELITKKFVINK
jgi:hypothetical protein